MEKIIEIKTCKHCNSQFEITDKDLEFYEKVSPVFNGKKYLIPSPTFCPECRQQRRLSWRNQSKLYKRNCSLTNKPFVSVYSEDKQFITYNQNDWWSDKYAPLDYGIDFDFSKTFFENFRLLQAKVPRVIISNGFSDNADYGNHSYHNKNSYCVNSCGYVEDCFYCTTAVKCKDCIDCNKLYNSERCYECNDSTELYNCRMCINCNNCSDLYFCEDMEGSKNCLFSKGLKNKTYYILNQKYNKSDYLLHKAKIINDPNFHNKICDKYEKLSLKFPSKNLKILNSENIELSNEIENSENLYQCFECKNSRDMKYCTEMLHLNAENCYDYDIWGENSSFIYEVHCLGKGKNILFSNIIWGGENLLYCDNCLNNSKNCFGCIGLKNYEEFYVFNKKYTKEEYEVLVGKIISHMMKTGEWGEFFPSSLSPFGYNETVAQEYFELHKTDALKKGFKWSDYQKRNPKVEKIIDPSQLPDSISQIPDDILNWAVKCEITDKPFKIEIKELEFYRKNNINIPKRHPDQRYLDRVKLRYPRKLYDRKCDKCLKGIKTSNSGKSGEIIYCEDCYNKEVY